MTSALCSPDPSISKSLRWKEEMRSLWYMRQPLAKVLSAHFASIFLRESTHTMPAPLQTSLVLVFLFAGLFRFDDTNV